MGMFNLTRRYTLIKAADEISKLRAKDYLNEYINLHRNAKEQWSECFNNLVYMRDLIKVYIENDISNKLIEMKKRWFDDKSDYPNYQSELEHINFISKQAQRPSEYLQTLEKNWFTDNDIGFSEFRFEALKNYCMFPILYAIPKSYLAEIYDSNEYKITIKYPIDLSHLHSVHGQIHALLDNYRDS